MSHSDFYDGKAAAYRKALSLLRGYRQVGDSLDKMEQDLRDLLAEAIDNKALEEGEE